MPRKWLALALAIVIAAGVLGIFGSRGGSSPAQEAPVQEEPGALEPVTAGNAEELLDKLTTEQKVGQLFFVRPEALDPNRTPEEAEDPAGPGVTQADPALQNTLQQYPVGGFVLFGKNLESPDQLSQLMDTLSRNAAVPLLFSVEEEGGAATQVAGRPGFSVPTLESLADIGATGDPAQAQAVGQTIGTYLRELGFQLDFAPVADVNTNPNNTVIGDRAFHSDPEQAAMMVSAAVDGFHQGGVACTLKHFPGHGDTAQDSHYGYASSDKTWEEMRTCELYPFQAGIAAGADAVMVSHITTPNATSDGLPASLSYEMITEKLRGELRFQRLVVTDSLAMEAITDSYSAAEASLMAFQAGADVLLMPADLGEAYDALLAAVQDGTISQERLDESVLRILQLKENYGLIS
ncbi:MAG TPA: glycoside hydrolase family 3 protein [Candidatus Evtepia faecavium]|nr:glycoside hydrolase family 3 protein [Candidatus Evtepia faecavium]